MAKKIDRKRVRFSLFAPDAREVCLAGTFNGWAPAGQKMKQDGGGGWTISLSLPKGEYEYRFLADGEWCDDPLCMNKRTNGLGSENCILVV